MQHSISGDKYRVEKPLLTMPKLCELCILNFADVQHLRQVPEKTPLRNLFITGDDRFIFHNWEALQLRTMSATLVIPEDITIPITLGLPAEKYRVGRWMGVDEHAKMLWVDHAQRSSGEFGTYRHF